MHYNLLLIKSQVANISLRKHNPSQNSLFGGYRWSSPNVESLTLKVLDLDIEVSRVTVDILCRSYVQQSTGCRARLHILHCMLSSDIPWSVTSFHAPSLPQYDGTITGWGCDLNVVDVDRAFAFIAFKIKKTLCM